MILENRDPEKKSRNKTVEARIIGRPPASLADEWSPDDDAVLVADEDDTVGVVVAVQRGGDGVALLENGPWAPAEKGQRHRFPNRCPATATNGLALRHRVFQPVP